MKKYTIGIDFGTLSARCVLVDCDDGKEIATHTYNYPHAVMDEALPCGKRLPPLFALQHPADYIEAFENAVKSTVLKSGVDKSDIKGLCIDFTASTVLPIDKNGMPLCFLEKYKSEPHAYVKLWKHHAAQPEANEINSLAEKMGESWLAVYGGKTSSEWIWPKILETAKKAPEVYRDADMFLEAGDWLSYQITGNKKHSLPFTAYKSLWNENNGYPSNEYFKNLHPSLDGVIGTKISESISKVGEKFGLLNEYGSKLTGLPIGLPVATTMPDAHVSMSALNITKEGELIIIIGTSSCHIVHSKEEKSVSGICGYVKGGVIPDIYTYEAGQSGVGDIFDWFVKNNLPYNYFKEAEERKINPHALLREKASRLKAGESGLITLDWLNGNRSTLDDGELSGLILGLTLRTKPEEIYRAFLESTAFGTKVIIDNFEEKGIRVDSIKICGGIALKDELLMQIYADVTGRTLQISGTAQAGALGSAIYAAVAGDVYENIETAAEKMSAPFVKTYIPSEESHKAYAELYQEYKKLYNYFGKGENTVMKKLMGK